MSASKRTGRARRASSSTGPSGRPGAAVPLRLPVWKKLMFGAVACGICLVVAALALAPRFVEALLLLGTRLQEAGDVETALRLGERLLEMSGGRNWMILDTRAVASAAAGRMPEAGAVGARLAGYREGGAYVEASGPSAGR